MIRVLLRLVAHAAVAAACGAASSGCLVVSLHPLYDEKSLIFSDALVGEWVNDADKATATLRRAEWNAYEVAYKDATNDLVLTGYLTSLDGEWFLDLTPRRGQDYGPFLVPVHGILKLKLDGEQLSTEALRYEWFVGSARARTLPVLQPTLDARDNVILSAQSRALRRWLRQHRKSRTPFAVPAVFTRAGVREPSTR